MSFSHYNLFQKIFLNSSFSDFFLVLKIFSFSSYVLFLLFLIYLYVFKNSFFYRIFYILDFKGVTNFLTLNVFLIRLGVVGRYYVYNLVLFKKLKNNNLRFISFLTLFFIFYLNNSTIILLILYILHCLDMLFFHLILKRFLNKFEKYLNFQKMNELEEYFFGNFDSSFNNLLSHIIMIISVVLYYFLELGVSINKSTELFEAQASFLIERKITLTKEEVDLLFVVNEEISKGILTRILEILFPN